MNGEAVNYVSSALEFLNANQGALLVVLTLVYVVATVVLVIANARTLREMRLTREEQQRPYVVVSFEDRRGGLLCLVLTNLGGSPAHGLSVEVDAKIIERLSEKSRAKISSLKNAALVLVPQQKLIFALGGLTDFHSLPRGSVRLRYRDRVGNTYDEETEFDFPSFGPALIYGPELDELKTVLAKEIKALREVLKSSRRPGRTSGMPETNQHRSEAGP